LRKDFVSIMAHDIVIRRGTVVDGTGRKGFQGDVAISGKRVTAIGEVNGRGRREIDAEGKIVCPGFVDVHTHMDAQVFWDTSGASSSANGVTTVVMGNCGFGIAPVKAGSEELALRSLQRAEDIPGEALATGIDWRWEHFRDYLAAVDAQPKAINYGANVPHSALRAYVMGERAFTEEATEQDLQGMAAELEDALSAGAVGFSTSRTQQHVTTTDQPVASRLASWDELDYLVSAIGQMKKPLFQIEGESSRFDPTSTVTYDHLRSFALTGGITVITSIAQPRNAESHRHQLKFVADILNSGGLAFNHITCRSISVYKSFMTTMPFDRLPVWRELRECDIAEQQLRLRDPELRASLIQSADVGNYGLGIRLDVEPPDWNHVWVVEHPIGPNRTVAEWAAGRGVHPVEAVIDLALDTGMAQWFRQDLANLDDGGLREMLHSEGSLMTFSDSGGHLNQLADSNIQPYFLAYWVRERQELELERAIYMMTAAPAQAYCLDRGVISEGHWADVNILDLDEIAPGLPELVSDLPAGATRLKHRASGIDFTITSGEVTFQHGEYTGAVPGELLRTVR